MSMVAFFILFGILPAISLREWARDLSHDYVALHVKREPNPELRGFPLRRWLRTMDPMELLFGIWGLLGIVMVICVAVSIAAHAFNFGALATLGIIGFLVTLFVAFRFGNADYR